VDPRPPSSTSVATPRPFPSLPSLPAERMRRRPRLRWLLTMVTVCGALFVTYAATSIYMATQIVDSTARPLDSQTPAEFGLVYRDVTFTAREDRVRLSGWFIPGVLPNGHLTTDRVLIVMHGNGANRQDTTIRLMYLVRDLARQGFAVLSFDMRNAGASAKALESFGLLESRDVLGAVDFVQKGALPFPELGRPRIIGGWGLSEGGTAMIYATAREPAIRALVTDSTESAWMPILQREFPIRGAKRFPLLGALMPAILPGAFVAESLIYGVNQYANRPVDVVASIAPRPLFFIHADHDDFVPSSMMDQLVSAASRPVNAHVQSWKVQHVDVHAQNYLEYSAEYVAKVAAFYTAALGPNQSQSSGS
jgi:uncharacterized protein